LFKSATEVEKFDRFSEKGKLKIDEICTRAAEVFSSKGYLTATLADVANAVGISKGGIYHYFSTKEELLFLILLRYMDQTLQELKEKLKSTGDHRARIRLFIHHHIAHYRDNFHQSRLILHEAHHLPAEYFDLVKQKEREYVNLLAENIRGLVTGYKDQPLKIKLVTFSLIGMCNWPYMWFNPKGSVPPEELAEEIYRVFVGDLPV